MTAVADSSFFTARCTSCMVLLLTRGSAFVTEEGEIRCFATTGQHTPEKLFEAVPVGEYPEVPEPAMVRTIHTFDEPLTLGRYVTGTYQVIARRPVSGRFAGTYMGIRKSEWDGEPVHFFMGGFIGTTPQPYHAFGADQEIRYRGRDKMA